MVAAAVAKSQAFAGAKAQARRTRRAVPVAAVQQRAEAAPAAAPLRLLAAGLAAAALSVGGPAEAGVVLVQPEVKNFVKDQPAAAKPAAGKKAAPKKEESSSSGGLAFETFRPLVLPLSVIAVVGAGAAAAKADPKFAELLDAEWSAKDSNAVGAGYETAPGLKDTPFYGGSNTNGAVAKKGTAKKAAPKKAGTAKKSALGSIFGSRD
ncbi:hypothetical protein CHLNCDRAFT_136988 [Chlorella variabilis]|uniref:Uncharacterized protein n=1 Tax=Chlorella variabilis TaxID=554065 RepID=E1ZLR4_CHLVA|nr:hypothetical protein CHLNCDRAFT_136988 [Chlorella variabilis]EFN53180.1 hypothetical protein CHLNCDRAFT_136988 [Chlorella variabilis]|eukprot:XP_005845282.1 hypothetical protein CHLNCDRAFT_136988 [Chlorella variabilis]